MSFDAFYIQKRRKKKHITNGKNICAIYADGAIAENTFRKWFASFESGNFDLENGDRSSSSVVISDDEIKTLIKINPDHTTRDILDIFHICHMSFVRHLKSFENRCNIWMPHDFTEKK